MDGVPSWAVGIILVVLCALGLVGGRRLRGVLTSEGDDDGDSTGAGYVVAASLGLLSLLIGFTLALSLDRYEIRRRLVVDEAAAVSTTWLRDQLLDQPYRAHIDGLLRAYVKERRGLASVGMSPAALDAADQRAGALQQRIWHETAEALRAPNAAPLVTTVLQSTNEMFDLQSARRAALDAQVPPPVLWALVAVALIAAVLTGYGFEAGRHRHRVASGALFFAVALTITLIVELDEPRGGLIRVPQAPFDRAANAILSAPPVSE